MRPLGAALVALAMLVPYAAAEDWPMFRYDETHQGFNAANTQFTLFKGNWWNNISIPSTVKASPVVKDGRVFIGAWDKAIYALDSESGGLLWKNTTGDKISGTAAVSENTVYVVTEAGTLYAFNAKTGALERQVSVGSTFGSPVVHERRVFIGNKQGQVSAYEGDTLEMVWRFPLASSTGPGGKYFNVTISDGGQVEGSPVTYNGQVLFGSTNQWFYSVSEQGTGDKKTTLTWMFKASGAIRGSPAIDKTNSRVVFGAMDGKVYSVPLASSGNVSAPAWTYQEFAAPSLPSQIQSSPAIAYGKAYVGANNGNVLAINAATGAKVWSRDVGGQVFSSPGVANNHVMVGSTDRKLYMLNAADGSVEWSGTSVASIESSPAIADTQAFWTDTAGNLYSWGGTKPERPDLAIESLSGALEQGTGGTIVAVIKNAGVLPSAATTVRFFAGNTLIATVPIGALEPGQATEAATSYSPTGRGSVQVRAVVDPTNELRETDESNNEKTVTVTIAPSRPPTTSATDTEAPGVGGLAAALAVLAVAAVVGARHRRR